MQGSPLVSDDFKLLMLLHQTRHATYRVLDKASRQLGITLLQAVVLVMIENSSATITPAELSRQMYREHTTVSALVRRMEKKGLVRLVKDLDRKNLIRVEMTEQGRQLYSTVIQGIGTRELASSLSEEEQQQLRSYLRRLRTKAFALLKTDLKPVFP